MSNGASYEIFSIYDMAAVPEEAWPRLIAEMPAMLRFAAATVEANRMLGGIAELIPTPLTWTDDGDTNITVTMEDEDNGISISMSGRPRS